MAVTIVEIAKELNLSHSTISRVLNGKAKNFISNKTQELVLDKAKEMGYTPNYHARALVTGKTKTIAFVGGYDLPDALYGLLIKEVRKMTLEKGYEVITGDPNTFLKISIDGMIGYGLCNFKAIRKLNIPIVDVEIGNNPPVMERIFDTVIVDVSDGFRFFLDHLYGEGCRDIAFVHTNAIEEWIRRKEPRAVLYREFVAKHGLTERYVDIKHHTREMIADEFYDYLQKNQKSDAYVCTNDNTALGVISALYRSGFSVPDDALVTGFDGMPDTKTSIPPLTTLDIDYKHALQVGIDLLMEKLLNNESSSKKVEVIKARAEIRESAQRKST